MGIYNRVAYPHPCPKCGEVVEWQTKDEECGAPPLDCLTIVKPEQVREWHTFCDKCDTYVKMWWALATDRPPYVEIQ